MHTLWVSSERIAEESYPPWSPDASLVILETPFVISSLSRHQVRLAAGLDGLDSHVSTARESAFSFLGLDLSFSLLGGSENK